MPQLIENNVVGQNIRRYRQAANLNQEELAERVWGDPRRKGEVSVLENGKQVPTLAQLDKIAAALNIAAADLLTSVTNNDELARVPA